MAEPQAMKLAFLRWVVLLAFLPGFLDSDLTRTDGSFVWLNLACLVACAWLFTRLSLPDHRTLWIWIILFVFLDGYIIQTAIIAQDVVNSFPILSVQNPELLWLSLPVIAAAYSWISAAFIIFCVVSWLTLGLPVRLHTGSQQCGIVSRVVFHRAIRLSLVVFVLSLFCSILQIHFHLAIAGAAVNQLPFRLNTVITRYLTYVAPGILLLLYWIIENSNHRRLSLVPLVFLSIQALIYSILSTARGGILAFMLPVVFLWVISNHLSKRKFAFLLGLLAATVVISPFLGTLRYARVVASQGLVDAILSSGSAYQGGDIVGLLGLTLDHIIIRVTGASGVWYALGYTANGISVTRTFNLLFGKDPLYEFFTTVIVGVLTPGDFRSPGLIGAFMLIGGAVGVVVFTVLYILATHLIWTVLSKFSTAPVSLALTAGVLLSSTSEGTLLFQNLLALLFVCILCEGLYAGVLSSPADSPSGASEPVNRYETRTGRY